MRSAGVLKNGLVLQIHMFLTIFVALAVPLQAATVTVCPSGCDYASVQTAVDNANPGDVIEVYSGTYYENVVIKKQVTVCGVNTGKGRPILDAGGRSNVITITADGVTIEGFKIEILNLPSLTS